MTRDRLLELRTKAGISKTNSTTPNHPQQTFENGDVSQPLIDHEAEFEMFLERCTNIRSGLASLNEDYGEITKLHGALLSTPGADADNSKNLRTRVDLFISKATQIRESLRIMSEETKALPNKSCGITRAKIEQVRSIFKSFETIMLKFNKEQEEYKGKAKSKIIDYLKIKNMQLSDEEIEDAVSSGNLSELTKGVMMALSEKKALYDDVKSRANELKLIEEQIANLAQMFHYLHSSVVSQGEIIDRIENSVENATEYAEKAKANVQEARNLRKKGRKLKIIVICAAIFLVIILLLLFQAAVCHFTPLC